MERIMFIMRIRIELWYLDDNIDVCDGGRAFQYSDNRSVLLRSNACLLSIKYSLLITISDNDRKRYTSSIVVWDHSNMTWPSLLFVPPFRVRVNISWKHEAITWNNFNLCVMLQWILTVVTIDTSKKTYQRLSNSKGQHCSPIPRRPHLYEKRSPWILHLNILYQHA